MTYREFQAIAVQAMGRVEGQLRILDLYAEPTRLELQAFAESVRASVELFRAAHGKYEDAGASLSGEV